MSELNVQDLQTLFEKVRADAFAEPPSLTTPVSAAWLLDHTNMGLILSGCTLGHPSPVLSGPGTQGSHFGRITIIGGSPSPEPPLAPPTPKTPLPTPVKAKWWVSLFIVLVLVQMCLVTVGITHDLAR